MTDRLREQINDGALRPDDLLLPERQLAEQYGVSLRGVRASLARLEDEGLISRQQGRGTIVLGKAEEKPSAVKQSNVALIILGKIRDTSTMEYFDSFQETLQGGGYGTLVLSSDNDPDTETRIVEQLAKEGVPGMVLFSAHQAQSFSHLEKAKAAGVEIALFDHYFPDLDCNSVVVDDRRAGFEAASHLIRLGCDDLIYIGGAYDWTALTLREEGFREAVSLEAGNVRSQVLRVSPFESMKAEIAAQLSSLQVDENRRLGVVAFNDAAALMAIDVLRAKGLSVPQDVAVMGFADDLDGAIGEVPLTTMQIPRDEIARLTAYLIMYQMRNPNHKPKRIELPARLIIRESCGCYLPRAQRLERNAERAKR